METFQPHNWNAWVGTDEAGKGDYFGSLVAAGVYVNAEIREQLHTLGVRDGKKLSDSRIRELAREIRMRWGHYATSIEVTPLQYNALYADFKRKGQNLNNLLASLHAKAIKHLHNRLDCRHVLVDRFAKRADVLESQLQPLTSTIELVQVPKAEGDIAVAAASIIARETFLRRLEQLSKRFDIQLPKGATSVIDVGRKFVEQHGAEALRHVAKLHFRTTDDILPKMINGSMG
jgi:ribonuclease HIII